MSSPHRIPAWIFALIVLGAGFFIFALLLSAVYDPKIRILHVLQALIYFAVIVLASKNNAWGFGAGCVIATFWNYSNLFVTHFIQAGVQQLVAWAATGSLRRPDLLVAVIAAAGHFLIIMGCAAGFIRLRPRVREWAQFAAGGALAIGYFVLIIVTAGPQYIGLMKRVFRI